MPAAVRARRGDEARIRGEPKHARHEPHALFDVCSPRHGAAEGVSRRYGTTARRFVVVTGRGEHNGENVRARVARCYVRKRPARVCGQDDGRAFDRVMQATAEQA